MSIWRSSRLLKIFLLMTSIFLWGTISVTGTEVPKPEKHIQSIVSVSSQSRTIRKIPLLSEIEQPSRDASLLVQTPAPTSPTTGQGTVIPITKVEAKATDKGVEVILQTTAGTQLQVVNRSTGTNFIADIIQGLRQVNKVGLQLLDCQLTLHVICPEAQQKRGPQSLSSHWVCSGVIKVNQDRRDRSSSHY